MTAPAFAPVSSRWEGVPVPSSAEEVVAELRAVRSGLSAALENLSAANPVPALPYLSGMVEAALTPGLARLELAYLRLCRALDGLDECAARYSGGGAR